MDKFALDDFRSRLTHRKEELQGGWSRSSTISMSP